MLRHPVAKRPTRALLLWMRVRNGVGARSEWGRSEVLGAPVTQLCVSRASTCGFVSLDLPYQVRGTATWDRGGKQNRTISTVDRCGANDLRFSVWDMTQKPSNEQEPERAHGVGRTTGMVIGLVSYTALHRAAELPRRAYCDCPHRLRVHARTDSRMARRTHRHRGRFRGR